MLKDFYDVVVVGAGPAGSCAAWRAALEGRTVLLLEKDAEIGVPVRCAEGISSRAVHAFLGEPKPDVISNRISHVRLTSPNGTSVTLAQELDGYVLDRRVFDKVLAARAASAGAEVLTSTPAVGMESTGAGWKLTLRLNSSEQSVYCTGVVGADGVESLVGRWAGLDTYTPIRDMESCYQYKLTGVDVDQDVIELVFGLHIAPGGYAWIFPKGEGIASVGLGIFRSVAREQITAKDYLDRWIQARFPSASCYDAVAGGVIIGTTLPSISTDGLVLVGDAAHQINPLGGAGISSGMRAGWLGAGVMSEQIAIGDTSAKAMRRYDLLWRRMLGKLHEDHRRLADAIFDISDNQFNSLAESLAGLPDEKRTLYAAISAAIRTRPSMLMRLAGYFRHWRSSDSAGGYPDRPPEFQPPG